jgi:hypothetical protein
MLQPKLREETIPARAEAAANPNTAAGKPTLQLSEK